MKKTMVYLEETQHKKLERLAHRRKTSMAALIRRAVEHILQEEDSVSRFSFIGAGEGPDDDVAVSEHPGRSVADILIRRMAE